MLLGLVDDELARAELGYLGAATLLCSLLAGVYRRPAASPAAAARVAAAAGDGSLIRPDR